MHSFKIKITKKIEAFLLNVFIESELNNNYSNTYKASRSILAINKLVKTPIENS